MPALDELKQYIVEQFAPDVRADELADDYDLLDNGVVTSLSLLRLIAWVGERVRIPVDEIDISPENFRSVLAIRQFIAEHSPSADTAVLSKTHQ